MNGYTCEITRVKRMFNTEQDAGCTGDTPPFLFAACVRYERHAVCVEDRFDTQALKFFSFKRFSFFFLIAK